MSDDEKIKEGVDKSVDSLNEVQGGSLVDISEFDGVKSKISVVTTKYVDSRYDETGQLLSGSSTRRVPKLLVMSEKLKEVETASGKKFEIRAQHFFGLKYELKGNQYISTGWSDKGKLAAFLTKHKVNHPKELIGKNVICRERAGFLDFYIE